MVQNVVFDGPVEESPAYETEIAVHGAASAAKEGPGAVGVVGEHGVGMLEECDGNWRFVVKSVNREQKEGLTNPMIGPQPWSSVK